MNYDKKPRKSTSDSRDYTAQRCPLCADADPNVRHRHFLDIFRQGDADGLREHLTTQYVDLKPVEKRRPDLVQDIVTWACAQREQWSGFVDPDTGAPLHWEAARAQAAQATAHRTPPPTKARPQSGAVKVLLSRLEPFLRTYPAVADRAWAAFHLDLMRHGFLRQTASAMQAQATAYRMLGQQYPELRSRCAAEAARCEQEAARLGERSEEPEPVMADDWTPYDVLTEEPVMVTEGGHDC